MQMCIIFSTTLSIFTLPPSGQMQCQVHCISLIQFAREKWAIEW